LYREEELNKNLNIITGFYVFDKQNHLIVLEGLYNKGIRYIYENIPRVSDDKGIQVLYNSSMAFSKRIYGSLDIDIFKVKLFESLDNIVQKPLLYVRDMTPKASFDALVKLQQLLSEYRLSSVIRCDLLPSAEMVLSLSKEFGVPLTDIEIDELKGSNHSETVIQNNNINPNSAYLDEGYDDTEVNVPHVSRFWTPLDNSNEKYIQLVEERKKQNFEKNFIENNLNQLHKQSEKNKLNKPIKHYIVNTDTTSNYSSQKLNSTEMGLNKFREFIKEVSCCYLYYYYIYFVKV
jgi:hypothetical protein